MNRLRILPLLLLLFQIGLHAQTASPVAGCLPLAVSFTPPAGVTSYFWDFQDGVTSQEASPNHLFTGAGVYEVSFRTGPAEPVLGTVVVTVYAIPQLVIASAPPAGCPGSLIEFTDITTYPEGLTPTSRLWTFGNGLSGSGESVSTSYANLGKYTVSLAITSELPGCATTRIFTDLIDIYAPPVADFSTTPNPPVSCEPPLTVSFQPNISSSYPAEILWTFGNNQSFNGELPPPVTYTESGTFPVTLSVTDINGCRSESTVFVSAGPANFDILVPEVACVDVPFTIANMAPAGLHNWNFGPTADPATSISRNPTVTYSQPGIYTISYQWVSPNGACSVDTVFTLEVEDASLDFEVLFPEPFCTLPATITIQPSRTDGTFAWNFGKYGDSQESNPSFVIEPDPHPFSVFGARLYRISLDWQSPGGCALSLVQTDTFYVPTAAFKALENTGVADFPVRFVDQSEARDIVRWKWHFGDGQVLEYSSAQDTTTHLYTTCGVLPVFLVIEDAQGCIDTSDTQFIRVSGCADPAPGQAFWTGQGPVTLCHGDTLFYSVQADEDVLRYRMVSDRERLWHCSNQPAGTNDHFWVFRHEPGPHDLHLFWETASGHRDSVLYPGAVIVEGAWSRPHYEIDCTTPFTVAFADSSLNATRREWLFPDGTTYTDAAFQHTFGETGDYLIRLQVWNEPSGCPPHTDSIMVFIRDIRADFTMQAEACQGANVPILGAASNDVNALCHRGYTWYFSQGPRPITLANPDTMASFGLPCANEVSLVVADINGCKDTMTRTINVQQVQAEIELPTDRICLPATINPQALVEVTCGQLETLTWTVGTLTFSGPNPVIQLPENFPTINGTIVLTLTAQSELGCVGVATRQISVYKPSSSIAVLPESGVICAGDEMSFTATDFTSEGSFLQFDWQFGNTQSATGAAVSTTYPNAGTYTVTLNFTEAATGCGGQITRNIEVQGYPQAAFTSNVDNQNVICHPRQLFFEDASTTTSPLTYLWDFGNGAPPVTAPNASAVYGKGSYTVSLTVSTSAGCSGSVERTFTLVGPEGSLDLDSEGICLGDPITLNLVDTVDVGTWEWFFEGVTYSNVNPVTHTYTFRPPSGQTWAKVVLTDPSGQCSLADSVLVPLVLTTADFSTPGTRFCPGSVLNITNLSQQANSYQWSFSSGAPSQAANPVLTLPNQTGTFIIQLTAINNQLGCRDSITREITLEQITLNQLFGDTICPGDTARIGILDPLEGYTITWSPAASVLDQGQATTRVVPAGTQTYSVTVDNGGGCSASGSVDVLVLGPLSFPDWDTLVIAESLVILPAPESELLTYTWLEGEGLSCQTCPRPSYLATEDREFVLRITDILGCFETEVTFVVRVKPGKILLPNLFTPNRDGTNDFFQIIVPSGSLDDIAVVSMKVFSRWGTLVYDNDTPSQGWDGTYKGSDLPSDVYAYLVEVVFFDGRRETLRGDITLVR